MKVFRVIFDFDEKGLKAYAKCTTVLTTDADKAIQLVKEMYPNILKILDVYEVTDEGILSYPII
jgi:hypothetical protein